MKFNRDKFCVGMVSLLLLVSAAIGQVNTSAIEGILMDPHGAVVPGATLTATLVSEDTRSAKVSTTSNSAGEFRFSGLGPSKYKLEFSHSMFPGTFPKFVEVPRNTSTTKPINIRLEFTLEPCSDVLSSDKPMQLTDADRGEIVRQLLNYLLTSRLLLFEEQSRPDATIVLSTKNLKEEWLSTEQRKKFNTMTQKEVQTKADTSGDFVYASIVKLEAKGNCVGASIENAWAVGKNSDMVYLSGGGFTYEFRKTSNRWLAKPVMGWIS